MPQDIKTVKEQENLLFVSPLQFVWSSPAALMEYKQSK